MASGWLSKIWYAISNQCPIRIRDGDMISSRHTIWSKVPDCPQIANNTGSGGGATGLFPQGMADFQGRSDAGRWFVLINLYRTVKKNEDVGTARLSLQTVEFVIINKRTGFPGCCQ